MRDGGHGGRLEEQHDPVAVSVVDEVDEAVNRVEDVAAVGEPDELLGDAGPVVLGPDLEQVVAREERQVVDELNARVVPGIDGKEERQADPEPVGEVHSRVRERLGAGERGLRRYVTPGELGSAICPGSILAGPLEAELVRQRVGEL